MFSGFDNPTYVARAVVLGGRIRTERLQQRSAARHDPQSRAARKQLVARGTAPRNGGLGNAADGFRRGGAAHAARSEVLCHLSLGLTNKEIAQSLKISYETVKEHVQHVLRKIGVTDRTQAAVWAVRRRVV